MSLSIASASSRLRPSGLMQIACLPCAAARRTARACTSGGATMSTTSTAGSAKWPRRGRRRTPGRRTARRRDAPIRLSPQRRSPTSSVRDAGEGRAGASPAPKSRPRRPRRRSVCSWQGDHAVLVQRLLGSEHELERRLAPQPLPPSAYRLQGPQRDQRSTAARRCIRSSTRGPGIPTRSPLRLGQASGRPSSLGCGGGRRWNCRPMPNTSREKFP